MDSLLDRVMAMQNAELFRRGVVLPHDSHAEALLRNNNATECTPVDYLEIPDQAFFETLWELGLFQEINCRVGSLLDDYEEDFIAPGQLECIAEAVAAVHCKVVAQRDDIQVFLTALSALAQKGQELKRSLLFVL